ncbi:hypothetical protein B0H13DRAFT_1917074 [Mycena leptocephala]|nr:hypothetical protein B0H13DRAFT_1917074 [Mycena leptocephala]
MATVDPNLHHISLPGRNPILLDVYACHNHLLVPPGDVNYPYMGKEATDPQWFGHPIKGTCTNPRDNALQAWLTPVHLMDLTVKANLHHATDEAMGNKDDITLEPPILKPDGTWTSGLAIKHGCEPVKQNTHCYTIANSFQSQWGTWAPTQGSKCIIIPLPASILISFPEVVALFPMTAMKQIPTETCNIIEEYTSMLNIPPLGLSGNTAHNTLQINVVPALPYGSAQTLEGSLGFYGRNHNNNKDSPTCFTNMTMCSHLPNTYTLSQFHIPCLSIYFTLCNFDSANFCGLNYHGRTPPVAPRGVALQKDAYCITFISYLPEKMGEGLGHVVIGYAHCQGSCSQDMAKSSWTFACIVFSSHMFLLLLIFLSNQLPLVYDFCIDSDHLLSAFSFEVDGTCESTVEMDLDADGDDDPSLNDGINLIAQATRRSDIKRCWHLHFNRLAKHIPYAIAHEKIYEIDKTGALMVPVTLVSDRVDALGNPIEPGGQPYTELSPAQTLAKMQRKLKAAQQKAEKDAARDAEAALDADNDSAKVDGPHHSKRKHGGNKGDSGPMEEPVFSSSSDDDMHEFHETSQSLLQQVCATWASNVFVEINTMLTTRGAAGHPGDPSTSLAINDCDHALVLEMEDGRAHFEDVTIVDDPMEDFFGRLIWPQFQRMQSKLYANNVLPADMAGCILQAGPDGWIGRLTKKVHLLMTTRGESRELRAADFGLDALEGMHVVAIVLDIIAQWLQFPVKSKLRAQVWFVEAIIQGCHPATLFLDSVWFAFGHLKTKIIGDHNAKIMSPSDFGRLAKALIRSALATQTLPEFLLLADMNNMLTNYRTRAIAAIGLPAP